MRVSKIKPLESNNEIYNASPSSCIVIATILNIYPIDSSQTNSWCNKFPCTALLQIDEIKSCGSDATGMIDLSTNTETNFAFTLSPTDSVDQSIAIKLPGLMVGDKIITTIHIHPAMNNKKKYAVYSYKKLPK